MKVWNEKRTVGGKTSIFTCFSWANSEVHMSIDAYEREDDSFAYSEPEGEVFYESYDISKSPRKIVAEALKTAAELIEKGWEDVTLSLQPVRSEYDGKASFIVRIHEDGVQVIFSVNREVLSEDCAKKLAMIRDILDSVGTLGAGR